MSREERTKLVEHLRYSRRIGADYTITDEDADEIIKALEQEPSCDDCIGRAEAMTEIQMNAKRYSLTKESGEMRQVEWSDFLISIRDALSILMELPPVQPKAEQEPKTGKWIKIQSGDVDFPESIVCSRCKNENSHLDFDEHCEPIGKVFVTSEYCPNCGAKMEVEGCD